LWGIIEGTYEKAERNYGQTKHEEEEKHFAKGGICEQTTGSNAGAEERINEPNNNALTVYSGSSDEMTQDILMVT
jgi:hypothetical protein